MRVGRWTATHCGVLLSKRDARIQEIDGKSQGKVEKKEYNANLSDVGDGGKPPLENMKTLRLNCLVVKIYHYQNLVGWENLSDGRIV